MPNPRSLAATLALVLTGCPLAMTDDYVSQGADDRTPAAVVDAGSTSMDAGVLPIDVRVCVPTTCLLLGAECGTAPDGCGAMLDCGMCKGDHPCGTKKPNRCD